jgi:GAF domain-containing protein
LERTIELTEADAGAIRLLDQNTQEVMLFAYRGLSDRYIEQASRLALSEEVVGLVVHSGEGILSDNMWEDARIGREVRTLLKKEGYRSLAQIPLRAQDEVLGALGVVAREPGFFDEGDLRLLDTIGQQLTTSIVSARLRRETIDAELLTTVGRVVTSVANELRSPLRGIIRSAEFLARPELSEPTRMDLSSAIVAMARRLINTSQELLDYTRGRRMALHRVPCSLPDFLEEVLVLQPHLR